MHDAQQSSSSELVNGCSGPCLGHLPPVVDLATKSCLAFGIYLGVFVSGISRAAGMVVSFCLFVIDNEASSNLPCRVVRGVLGIGVVEFGLVLWMLLLLRNPAVWSERFSAKLD